jgi:hypoxia up-regulated 1
MGLYFLIFLSCFLATVNSVAVISIDLGNVFHKIGIVKPGMPMEIVLNIESNRKTVTAVTLKQDERLFGNAALNAGIKKPQTMFTNFLELLGKQYEHSIVETYKSRFPYHNLVSTDRGTVQFKINDDTYYTVEELLAMVLNNSRNMAVEFAGEPINNVIVTIPGYYNQAERRAVADAVQISGLKLLQLMTDHTAVALNFGIFRRDEYKESPTYNIFYDMGATSTKVTVVEYKLDKLQEGSLAENHPHLIVRGFGYDRTLGGSEFDFRLRKYLAEEFTKSKKSSVPITDSPKAMAKLLKEATRVKQILSANTETYAQVEGLHEEIDFKFRVTRQKFEELSADLYDRVAAPLEMALKTADLQLEMIDHFLVVGGSFRIPKVQEKLAEVLKGKEISKNINADEAAALGAVYHAAYLSSAFKVKRFVVKDASLFAMDVSFDRLYVDEEDGQEKIKSVDRTIINKMNVVPQKKMMTFSRMYDDFSFIVKYSNLDHLPAAEREYFKSSILMNVAVAGVREAAEKHTNEANITEKGVKAHFRIDESGLVELVSIENTFEKKYLEELEIAAEESAFSKLTSKIGSFFSGANDENNSTDTPSPSDTPKEDDDKSTDGAKSSEDPKSDKTENQENETSSTGPTEKIVLKETKLEEKTKQIKEPMTFTIDVRDLPRVTETAAKNSNEKLKQLSIRDLEKLATAKSLNDLESFIIGTQEKLEYSDNYKLVTTEAEREDFGTLLAAAGEWVYDEGIGLSAKEYKEKLNALKNELKPMANRLQEMDERPKALSALRNVLNQSSVFLNISRNLPEEAQIFTDVELQKLEETVAETLTYESAIKMKFEAMLLHETPPILTQEIGVKITALDRELQYLVSKARLAKYNKPKTEKPPVKPGKSQEKETEEDNDIEIPAEDSTSQEKSTEKPETLELPAADDSATGKPTEDTPNPEL